ncbi:hypothetical protein ACOACO_14655 [Nocardioides sp. CPCC 205120]|uniref:hypothetical protein n=1 Tax=Nocardioides sp. CPCC 205120 TaxID=3406462 RepID=UPI003B508CC1
MVGPEKPVAGETSTATGSQASEGSGATATAPRRRPSFSVARARTVVAQVVWIVCLVAATALAVAALCIAVDANQGNGLVSLVLDLAGFFDLGVFTLDDGIMAFTGDNADTKNALVNYGLGAAFWLVLGRILERLVRP